MIGVIVLTSFVNVGKSQSEGNSKSTRLRRGNIMRWAICKILIDSNENRNLFHASKSHE